jgi:hypothetical protein
MLFLLAPLHMATIISFAVTTLAKFLINPALEHYQALKHLTIYLQRQIHWGIIYWQPSPVSLVPVLPIELDVPNEDLPLVPWPSSYIDPGTYVDASLGNIPIRMASTLAGGAITWRSKTQLITAQNVSEAELIAGNAAGKVVKYIHMVLTDLGFRPLDPPPSGKITNWTSRSSTMIALHHNHAT